MIKMIENKRAVSGTGALLNVGHHLMTFPFPQRKIFTLI